MRFSLLRVTHRILSPVSGAASEEKHVGSCRLRYPAAGPLMRAQSQQVGTWLSLVERTLGVGEVASSNLVVPTIFFPYPRNAG